MECAGCNLKNREGAKFCKNCGAKGEHVCPSCGRSGEPESSFCDEWGHDLKGSRESVPKELSFHEKLAKIQEYLPTSLAEKILAQRDGIGAHRCNQIMFHLGRNYALYSELFRQKGDTSKAKEQLGKAIESYKECGPEGWVTKAQEELGRSC